MNVMLLSSRNADAGKDWLIWTQKPETTYKNMLDMKERLDTLIIPSFISELESQDMGLFDNAEQLGCARLYDMRGVGGPWVSGE